MHTAIFDTCAVRVWVYVNEMTMNIYLYIYMINVHETKSQLIHGCP